jgi:CxxC motif-containing protein
LTDKEITCIVCPIGCKILVKVNGKKVEIKEGSRCRRGIEYARSEALDPKRVLTSSVLVENAKWPLLSVKTNKPVPKDRIFDVLDEIKKVKVKSPIKIGQIVIKNVSDLNIDVIATKSLG